MPDAIKVLLLKAADDNYATALTTRVVPTGSGDGHVSFAAFFADVLAFEYVNKALMAEKLLNIDQYGALFITSPRGAIAIVNAVNQLTDPTLKQQTVEKLQSSLIFSVGAATSRELQPLGVTCQGDESGSAEVLAEYVHQDGILPIECKQKPMLFICGEKRRDTLPESFRERQMTLEELVVYRTVAVDKITVPKECAAPDWIAFFSPSGLKAVRHLDFPWETIKKVAIGKTTASALHNYAEETRLPYWEATVVAAKPTADALADAIYEYECSNSS